MKYISVLILLIASLTAQSQVINYSEKEIADYIQSIIGGEREVVVESGRIDLVTDKVAFEIEWANNWKESIGQSLWYALQSNKEPGIILLLRSEKDYKYFIQLNSTLQYSNLEGKVNVYLFPNDFEHLMQKR